jgi:hypothetical protein
MLFYEDHSQSDFDLFLFLEVWKLHFLRLRSYQVIIEGEDLLIFWIVQTQLIG